MTAFGDFIFDGLLSTDRLFVMAQNPANSFHWSKPIGPTFTVAELKRACAILDAAEAMREALGVATASPESAPTGSLTNQSPSQ